MDVESNPNSLPETVTAHTPLYSVSPFRSFLRKPTAVLGEQIEQRAEQGWRLVTSWDVGGSDCYLVWTRDVGDVMNRNVVSQYRILPRPSFLQCVRGCSFSPWPRAIADEVARMPAGWTIEAVCASVGYVLRYRPGSTVEPTGHDDYSVLRCSPVWWRTMFGDSWMPILSEKLSILSRSGFEIIACLGSDLYLTRARPVSSPSESNGGDDPRSYRLAMWPNWRRILVPGTPNIAPWFGEESARGWELLSHYGGAIFLFRATTV